MSERFELPGELNIYSVLDVRDALLTWLGMVSSSAQDTLQVSARDVGEVDGAGLQLLVSLSHADRPWRLVDPSEALMDACRTIGLEKWLEACTQGGEHETERA